MGMLSGILAGKAFVVIDAVDHTGPILRKVRADMRQFGTDMMGLGRELVTISALMSAPLVTAANVYNEFDDSMRRVQARSSGTSEEMAALREQAMLLGRTTSFTASQIAEMQAALAQKGFNRKAIHEMTEAVLTLARGAGAGLPTDSVNATNLISGAIRAYRMESDDARQVADVFTAAVNNSNFSLDELIVSMSYASTIAHEYNMSLEETAAMLATMRNVNINASTAGTAFRNMLLRLSSEAGRNKFNKELKALNGNMVTMVDESHNLRPIPNILVDINKAMEGLGTSQKGSLMGGLFGLRAVVPATTVATMLDDYQDMLGIMQGANGLAKQTEKLMDAGPGGALRIMQSAIEGVQIALGTAFEDPEISLSKWLEGVLDKFTQWTEQNKEAVNQYVLATAALGTLGVSFLGLGMSINAVSYAAGGLLAVWGLFTSLLLRTPHVAVLLGVYKLADALGLVEIMAIRVQELMNSLNLQNLSAEVSQFKNDLVSDWEEIVSIFSAGQIEAAWELIMLEMSHKWGSFVDGFKEMLGELNIAMKELWLGATIQAFRANQWFNSGLTREQAQSMTAEQVAQFKEEQVQQFVANNPIARELQKERGQMTDIKRAHDEAYRLERELIESKIANAKKVIASLPPDADPQITPVPQPALESAINTIANQQQPTAMVPALAESMQKGSVEAARQAYESKQRDMQLQQIDIQTKQLEELQEQTNLLETLSLGGV